MATAYTSLLGLALPVTGELSGTWGNTVNTEITSLLDSAISGTTTISTDADITLTTTTGAANEAREAIILWTAGGTTTRNITAPAQSKTYIVINASSSTQSIVLRGAGPTTGVTIIKGESAVCAWNGTDFIKVSNISGAGVFSSLTVTGTTTLSGLTASTALALDASKNVVSVTNTGTGNNVLATSPTLVTPALGTPSSGVVTNLTGTASININGTVGATTANTGAFTTLTSSSDATLHGLTVGRGAGAVATNTAVGASALAANQAGGTNNTAIGNAALDANTTGDANTAVGDDALGSNTTASNNTAVGYQAGYSNTTAASNTAVGALAGYGITTGPYNTVVGYFAGYALTTGAGNTFVGSFQSGGTAGAGSAVTTGSKNVILGGYTGGAAPISATGSNYIVLSDGDGTVRQTIDSSGNVGIGTTAPATVGVSGYTRLVLGAGASSTDGLTIVPSATGGIQFTDAAATEKGFLKWTASTGALTFGTAATERMRIDSSGNVGIGTSSPTAKVQITRTALTGFLSRTSATLTLEDTAGTELYFASNTTGYGQLRFGDTDSNFRGAVTYDHSVDSMYFVTAGSERMRIDSSGNVGIGTSSPLSGYKLNVGSTSTVLSLEGAAVTLFTSGSLTSNVGGVLNFRPQLGTTINDIFNLSICAYDHSGDGNADGLSINGSDGVSFSTGSNSRSERMRIDSGGIVTMNAYGAGAATFSAAGVISSVSDETWKIKDGVPVDVDSMLNKLEPGYWYYNDEKKETFGSDRQLGFYAQNVNAAIGPEAAPIPEEGKPWGYYDRSVLAVTVMSLQKALATIESLTARIAALEST